MRRTASWHPRRHDRPSSTGVVVDVKAEPVILSEPWRRDANGELLVGGQPLSRVVAAVGSTPCYVYDRARIDARVQGLRSEEHTSELQSRENLVCRLLL